MNANIFLTYNLQNLAVYSATNKLVFMNENKTLSDQFDGVFASILLPPYEAMMAEMDNNPQLFYQIYYTHLNSPEASRFIAAMLRALYEGTNLCIYIEAHSQGLLFNNAFIEYMANTFGVLLGVDQQVAYMNTPETYANILIILYNNELLTLEELMRNYPQGLPIDPTLLPRLIQESNAPYLQTENEYLSYFFEYKERIKANNNQFLLSGITFN